MSCGTALEARRNSDERWTFTPSSRNYTFSGMAPLFTVRRGQTVLLQIDQTQTVNGSLFSVVGDSVVLQLKKGDAALLDGPTPDTDAEALFYDVTLTDQTGFENWIIGGPFTLLGLNDVSCGGCNEKVEVTLGGQCIQINIEGGNVGIGASVNLNALNKAVQDAETAAGEAAQSATEAATAGADAGAAAGATAGANAGAEAGETAAQAVVAGKANLNGDNLSPTQSVEFRQAIRAQSDLRYVNPADWGIVPSNPDNTAAWNLMEAALADGAVVVFPVGNDLYVGNFHSKKSISIDGNGNRFRAETNGNCIRIGPAGGDPGGGLGDFTQYTCVEAGLQRGATTFTVLGASTLFKAGDVGFLWDGCLRPPDDDLRRNEEAVLIKSVVGDVVTIEGSLYAHKARTGSLYFFHSTYQVRDAYIKNVAYDGVSGYGSSTFLITNGRNVRMDNISGQRFGGSLAIMRYCYGVTFRDIYPEAPNATTAGQGYGANAYACTGIVAEKIHGRGLRHVYDQDAAYDFYLRNISDPEALFVPCFLSHNGFCSDGMVDGVLASCPQAAVATSGQGYGTGPAHARVEDHPVRNVSIRNVRNNVTGSPDTPNNPGVHIRSDVAGLVLDNINVQFSSPTLTSATATSVVRIDGKPIGSVAIREISANAASIGVNLIGATVSTALRSPAIINGVTIGTCARLVVVEGEWGISLDNATCDTVLSGGGPLVEFKMSGSFSPFFAGIGPNVRRTTSDHNGPIWGVGAGLTTLLGIAPKNSFRVANAVSVTDGGTVPNTLQYRNAMVNLNSGTASALTMAANALPRPVILGEELVLYNGFGAGSSRGDITFPGAVGQSLRDTFTIQNNGKPVILRCNSTTENSWRLVS